MHDLHCGVCGGTSFREQKVLWPELIAEWQLSEAERDTIDRQQGCLCEGCGANLRIIALADAIRARAGTALPLREAIADGMLDGWRVLDCNGADGLSAALVALPGYLRADYPDYDMRRLPFADGSFDLILHSDTLEHVEHPLVALEECRRLLAPGGQLSFTVPTIHGRLTRNRAGLAPSYHGDPAEGRGDYLVHTEFGADVWAMVLTAGFRGVAISAVRFPDAIAITAWADARPVPAPPATRAAQPVPDPTAPAETEVPPPQPTAEADDADPVYDQDGLRSRHNHEFMHDPEFQAAYARGVQAAGADYGWHWRVHTGLWAARMAAKLPGDFAEFGVNRGFMSSAIMHLLDWNGTGRRFYLLDTFAGIDERYINDDDRAIGVIERNQHDIDIGFYTFDVDAVRANFAQWPAARVIQGPVPDTLAQIDSHCFAFAHIDMNCAPPEVAAAEFLWPRLVRGGLILLDDYAFVGYRSQKLAMDEFARSKGTQVLSLPTGQGLLIKA